MMIDWVKDGLGLYGPLGIGWIVAAILGWRLWFDTSRVIEAARQHDEVVKAYHEAICKNSVVMERLAMLIEERSRLQSQRGAL